MNFTEYFYENWLDKLVTVIGVILGVVGGVGILISKVSESIKRFKVCSDEVKERGKELVEANNESKILNEKLKEYLKELQEYGLETKRLNSNYKSIEKRFSKENETIKKVLFIAFASDPNLVKQGRADEIREILEGEYNEIDSETAI